MKKYFLFCACLTVLLWAVSGYSQGLQNEIKVSPGLQTDIKVVKPDFSGKWKLNLEKSRWRRQTSPSRRPAEMSWILVIEQKLPAIVITVRSQRGTSDDANFFGGRFTLYSDGRGDECIEDSRGIASTTRWQGSKLITTDYNREDGPDQVDSIEEFELSADGNTLMHTSKYTQLGLNAKGELERFWDDSMTSYQVFDRIK